MSIRAKASTILDVPIREGRWLTYTEALDREGKFDRKKMLELIMSLCEEVEVLEQKVELLEGMIDKGKWLVEKEIPGVGQIVKRERDEKGHFIKAKEEDGAASDRS